MSVFYESKERPTILVLDDTPANLALVANVLGVGSIAELHAGFPMCQVLITCRQE